MIHTTAPPPLLIFIGIAFLAGACALAYLSSVATLTVTRISPSSFDVGIEDRLFGVWPIASERFTGVRAVRSVTPRPAGSTRTSNVSFLVFDTPSGEVFAGPSHHFFTRDVGNISDFVADPARKELVLTVTDRGAELFRFLFAQACVLFLALIGGFLIWLGARTLFPDPNAGVGPH